MPTPAKTEPLAYCILDYTGDLVLPADVAMQLFPLLCQAEVVTYDWSNKTYKRMSVDRKVTLKSFSVAEYASLALNSTD